CGKMREDGTRGAGLLDVVDHGYRLHDYEDHGTPVEVEAERRRKQHEQKRARRAAQKRRKAEQLSADCPRTETDAAGGLSADCPETTVETGPGQPADAPPRACAHARDPQPSPAQPSPSDDHPPTPLAKGRSLKPKVSPLTAGDIQALELEFMTAPS